MSGLFTVVVVMCASALICSLVQTFVTDGSTKKIISLVLGAFIICCMVVPVKNAISSFNTNVEENQNSVKEISTDDAYSNAVIKQTEINLETALKNLLLQNNITIKSCDIILSRVENNGIIIASISIYIDKEFVRYTNLVSSIVYDNFGITPNIMTE